MRARIYVVDGNSHIVQRRSKSGTIQRKHQIPSYALNCEMGMHCRCVFVTKFQIRMLSSRPNSAAIRSLFDEIASEKGN